jgi:hypothetical protein
MPATSASPRILRFAESLILRRRAVVAAIAARTVVSLDYEHLLCASCQQSCGREATEARADYDHVVGFLAGFLENAHAVRNSASQAFGLRRTPRFSPFRNARQ